MPLDTLYSEYVNERQMIGMIVDVSERGLRVQRVLKRSGQTSRLLQLEFELPGTGEVIWAKGEVCFDGLWQVPLDSEGRVATLRTSGVRVVGAAGKHLRLMRDYVRELRRDEADFAPERRSEARELEEPWWMRAASLRH
jgi:hypothetical protein